MFRLSRVIIRPFKEQIQCCLKYTVHSGISSAYNRWYNYCKGTCVVSYNTYVYILVCNKIMIKN
jgi:hypothetical protein